MVTCVLSAPKREALPAARMATKTRMALSPGARGSFPRSVTLRRGFAVHLSKYHLAPLGLDDLRDLDIQRFADVVLAVFDNDHRAVIEIADTLPRLIPLAYDR